MNMEEQMKLAVSCLKSAPICRNLSIVSLDSNELSTYTAAVEAKQSEKIEELKSALLWYVNNDDVEEGGKWEEINDYWLEGKRNAERLIKEP